MKRTWCFVMGLLLAALLAVAVATPALAAGFSDIDDSPFEASINALAYKGYIGGFEDGTFRPDSLVTRQQFAKMIVNALDLSVTGTEVCPFVDVSATPTGTDPFYPAKYVAVCALNNITKGTDATHFAPGLNIKRAQMITMVVRAAENLAAGTLQSADSGWTGELPALSYSDPTHGANIRKAEFNGLLAGIPDLESWNTNGNASRGETAEILAQLFYRTGEVLTLTGPSGTQEFTLAELEALDSVQGFGGWKNSVATIVGPKLYNGVSMQTLMTLAGGGATVTVEASDGYRVTYDADDVAGNLHDAAGHLQRVYDPATGTEITSYAGQLTMILAYEADGKHLSSSEGIFRIGFIGAAADQVTDSKLWESQVVKIEVH